MSLQIVEVPCGSDNYAYVVRRPGRTQALVIDPTAAEPVLSALASAELELEAVLATHHHFDHVAGIEGLLERHAGAAVFAHVSDRGRVPRQSRDVVDGQPFDAAGMTVRPRHVPGHTRGAVAYGIDDALFTGDTLFVAGCGRLFEGTADQMYDSLCNKLATLPGATRVYCGHEYTAANLRFALTVEPDNPRLAERLTWADQRTERGEPTVPSTLEAELATNPFLRCHQPEIAARFGGGSPVEVFAAVRRAKDAF